MDDRQTLLIEEQKMNEERIRHIVEMMMSLVKFYFVTVFSIATVVTALYHYEILEDISRLVVYFLLLPLLIFGFTIFFSLKKLLYEYNYWLPIRSQIKLELFRGDADEFHPSFEHPLKPFVSLIRLILTGNTLAFIVLVVPQFRTLSGWGWLLPIVISTIFVLVLLAALSVVALNGARQKSRDSRRVADVRQIQTALELFYADNGHYPIHGTEDQLLVFDGNQMLRTSGIVPSGPHTPDEIVYMSLLPANPQPGGGPYTYVSDGSNYRIEFELEGSVGDIIKGKHLATSTGIH